MSDTAQHTGRFRQESTRSMSDVLFSWKRRALPAVTDPARLAEKPAAGMERASPDAQESGDMI